MPNECPSPRLSVVVPFYNEQDSVIELIADIVAALADGPSYEIIAVDDGSIDATLTQLQVAADNVAGLRVVAHSNNRGQSAALVTGVRTARGAVIATLDGDGQNPPSELPRLLAVYAAAGTPTIVVGRRHARCDSAWRLLCSRLANRVRQSVLHDGCHDTGCSLKVLSRVLFLGCPQFDHMHRFLPALAARAGASIINIDVDHRPRRHGQSTYGVGNRLWAGIVDMLGVAWLARRRLVDQDEVHELR